MTHTEDQLISSWLDLTGEAFGEYAWAGPGTWCKIAQLNFGHDLMRGKDAGSLGVYEWIKPEPFAVKILMNPFAKEGFIYPAHHGTPIFEFVNL